MDEQFETNTEKPNGGTRAFKAGPPPPEIYGRLELLAPIPLNNNGATSKEVVIFRPTAGAMTSVLDTPRIQVQIERFVDACVRAVNGGGDPVPFRAQELCSIDGSELAGVITSMSEDADNVLLEDNGDGITSPIVYTLQRPIALNPNIDGGEVLNQFAFEARKVGDIAEFLDARGETKEFHTFMRTFGRPLGIRIPIMTDALINAVDFLDYLVIRRQIMGKFILSRRRWKRESSPVRLTTTGPLAAGIN